MKKLMVAVLASVVVGVTLLGAAAYAGGFDGQGERRAYRFLSMKLDNLLDDLNATDAQRAQIDRVKDELFEQAKALKPGLDATHEELKAQWDAPSVDRARVHRLVDERIDALRDFAHRAADAFVTVHDTLTPEQRAQVAKLREQRQLRHHW